VRGDAATEMTVGETVGSYWIVRALGTGGMGSVYEVEHVRLGVRFALKAFSLAEGDRAFLRKRFAAEGRILARIRDPRVVRVIDLDVESATDTPYFVMDLVLGPDGAPQTLAGASAAGRVPEAKLLGWYDDLRIALSVAHAAGVVHRDIKPDNVLIDGDGRAVLADFGVCRIVDDALRAQIAVTRTMAAGTETARAVVLGTVAYLSPELAAGAEPTPADDFYALGVTFFRLLTGVWYAPGTNVMDLLLPFDPAWKTVFAALLAVDPARRHAPDVRPRAAPVKTANTGLRLCLGLIAALTVFCAVLAWALASARTTPPGVAETENPEDALYIPESAR